MKRKVASVLVAFKNLPGLVRKRSLAIPTIIVLLIVAGHVAVFIRQGGHASVYYAGIPLEGANPEEMSRSLSERLETVHITAHTISTSLDINALGVELIEESFKPDIEDAWRWDKHLPLWGTSRLLRDKTVSPGYLVDEERMFEASIKLAGELLQQPTNASLSLENEEVIVTPERDGARYSAETVYNALDSYFSLRPTPDVLEVTGEKIPAAVTAEVLSAVSERYSEIAGRELTVEIDDQQFTLTTDQILGLIDVEATDIALNDQAVQDLVSQWSDSIAVTPGLTEVTYVDDVVTQQTEGVVGQFIDVDAVTSALQAWITAPDDTAITIEVTQVQPEIIEYRS